MAVFVKKKNNHTNKKVFLFKMWATAEAQQKEVEEFEKKKLFSFFFQTAI